MLLNCCLCLYFCIKSNPLYLHQLKPNAKISNYCGNTAHGMATHPTAAIFQSKAMLRLTPVFLIKLNLHIRKNNNLKHLRCSRKMPAV